MSKKTNTQRLREYLSGQHSSQQRTSISLSNTGHNKKRELGEIWYETDVNGVTHRWEQKDGFRVKTAANSIIESVREALTIPSLCPECGNSMHDHEKRLHEKMYRIHKKCFSCVLVMERKIKLQGAHAWEEYSKKYMRSNAEAWLKDTDREIEILREALKGKLTYVNADGSLETWDQTDRDRYLDFIDNEYVKFREQLLKDLE